MVRDGDALNHVTRLAVPELTVTVRESTAATFSLDGEMISAERLALRAEPDALTLRVGEGYEPHPEP